MRSTFGWDSCGAQEVMGRDRGGAHIGRTVEWIVLDTAMPETEPLVLLCSIVILW